ncbi:MAG TPA: NAD(+)/NADH kinase [Lacipirellulaceae bacterium]|jgi:NAD+ kinase|nr:NAD(+)/NADH kinase [Lacipirellulaceae bacterium]
MASKALPRAMVFADGSRPELRSAAERLRPTIERYLAVVGESLDFAEPLKTVEFDLAIVLGGDGSILRAAHLMGYDQRPVLGINLGRLGFLAALQPEQLEQALPQLASGDHQVISHLMVECTATRRGKVIYQSLGLNEASVLAGPPFAMVDIELYVDGELVTTYSCDGLIVSTPVGSTAHCLSAGGPILRNDIQALVILPISPHTLTLRPVVDSADRVIELVVPEPHAGTSLVVDGRVLGKLEAGDRIRIVRSKAYFKMVTVCGQSYYRTLHDKLGWGGQLRLKK